MIRHPKDIHAGSRTQIHFHLGQRKLNLRHRKQIGKQKGIKYFKFKEVEVIE